MNLPDLTLQLIYGRLAWGIVLATLLVALWPRRLGLSNFMVAIITAGMIALQVLPGPASPAYWLGLAFQLPSCLLVGMCCAKLYLAAPGMALRETVMAPALALLIAGAGTVLYLDAMGLISLGLYYWGFGPNAAPLMAVLLAAVGAAAIARGKARPQAYALLIGMLGFSILRLPTGNIWDALLDPLLWGWALVALVRSRWRRTRRAASASAPAN